MIHADPALAIIGAFSEPSLLASTATSKYNTKVTVLFQHLLAFFPSLPPGR
jgi:hypothetical protein